MFKKIYKSIYKTHLKKIKARYDLKLNKTLRDFSAILKDDIKTPLLAQNCALELVLKSGLEEKERREILDETLRSNNFLLEILQNVLLLLELEGNNLSPKYEKVDILKTLNDVCKKLEKKAKRNIVIKNNSNTPLHLSADVKMTEKLLYNIISSSIAHSTENSDIELIVEKREDSFYFLAQNSSQYMSKEKSASFYQPRTHEGDLNKLGEKLNISVAQKLISAQKWDSVALLEKDNQSGFGFIVKKC